jgi:hypothetical protein
MLYVVVLIHDNSMKLSVKNDYYIRCCQEVPYYFPRDPKRPNLDLQHKERRIWVDIPNKQILVEIFGTDQW